MPDSAITSEDENPLTSEPAATALRASAPQRRHGEGFEEFAMAPSARNRLTLTDARIGAPGDAVAPWLTHALAAPCQAPLGRRGQGRPRAPHRAPSG